MFASVALYCTIILKFVLGEASPTCAEQKREQIKRAHGHMPVWHKIYYTTERAEQWHENTPR
jgi:hypothetical protein